MSERVYLAVDLGASGGRVMAGRYDGRRLGLDEVHRFPNGPVERQGSFRWPIEDLFQEVLAGLRKAGRLFGPGVASMGVDTWGVDYGLLDETGRLLDVPYAYRDPRTEGMPERAEQLVPRREIYEITGIQFMPINTLYQLLAEGDHLDRAHRLLFMPDLFHHWLTGRQANERTIASTGQLLDARTGDWASGLMERMGIPRRLFGPLVEPGTGLGPLSGEVVEKTDLAGARVIAPGTHDTASAVAAVPFAGSTRAFLSSGTWSLMGIETTEPVVTDASYACGFTNERGVCGTVRVLKNICGLWLLQECRRVWTERGASMDYEELVRLAQQEEPFVAVINPDDPRFAPPGDMPRRIRAWCDESHQRVPESPGSVTRVVLESLALRYRSVLDMLEQLSGQRIEQVHIVGGGVRNRLLNQFAANATGRPIVTGPVEATAAGNVLMQMLAAGEIASLTQGRELVGRSFEVETYEPANTAAWDDAYGRFLEVTEA